MAERTPVSAELAPTAATEPTRVVLVGAGYAHLHVLREWRRRPIPDVELVVVSPTARQWHAGMMSGYLEGRYAMADICIDVAALAREAGARLIVAPAKSVSAAQRLVLVAHEHIPFNLCSVDVGCDMSGADIPGMREHAVMLQPVEQATRLRNQLDALLATGRAPLSVVIVGAGSAGVEAAFAIDARLTRAAAAGQVTIVDGSSTVLAGEPARLQRRAASLLRARGIGVVLGGRVTEVEEDQVMLASGAVIPADLIVWATGAAPPALLAHSDLPCDDAGYLLVDSRLRATGTLPVWGAGDCVTIARHPRLSRSGVQAAREGPILLRNLRAALGAGRARRFHPRDDAVMLLSTADGRALARRGRMSGYGRWASWVMERRNRQFVARFGAPCDERPVPAG